MRKIAVSMPGKIGDCLYALPATLELCRQYNATADFYTSEYCTPLKRLYEYQWCIDNLIVPEEYQIERMDMGIQPWHMPIPISKYDQVYHLGFRRVPDETLHNFMARSVGLPINLPIAYDYPDIGTQDEPYIVLAARGQTDYTDLFLEVIEKCPIRVIQIGGEGEAIGYDLGITGTDMLETVSWIAKSKGFVGLMSSQLALANGFSIPKVAPHDGRSWDMRHAVYSPYNHYPVKPSAEEILGLLGL